MPSPQPKAKLKHTIAIRPNYYQFFHLCQSFFFPRRAIASSLSDFTLALIRKHICNTEPISSAL